ncbi:MAG: hypothetical protein EBE86_030565 [Hormoscilla sp. GUM202]|nr:hypothetical protein [Hormoscilla sp. GUM202]
MEKRNPVSRPTARSPSCPLARNRVSTRSFSFPQGGKKKPGFSSHRPIAGDTSDRLY